MAVLAESSGRGGGGEVLTARTTHPQPSPTQNEALPTHSFAGSFSGPHGKKGETDEGTGALGMASPPPRLGRTSH